MSSILHSLGAGAHWLYTWVYAHLASVGISAVVTVIGGLIMWFLGFRKAKLSNEKLALEIGHIRVDTKRLELEIQKLTDEREQRESTKKLSDLSDTIFNLAKERKKTSGRGDAIVVTEAELSVTLKQPLDAINKALRTLQDQERARYAPGFESWIVLV